jgi:hypothetical protein
MKQLTWQDTQSLLHAIQELNSIRDLNFFGLKALTIVNQIVPSEFPNFTLSDTKTHQVYPTCLPGYPTPNPEAVIALNRSQRNFTERDRLILNLLCPHLFQAFGNAQRYHQLQQNVTQLQQSLDRSGVICLDETGQVKLMTSQVATWLQSYFPSHRNGNELPEKLHSWVKHQLVLGSFW